MINLSDPFSGAKTSADPLRTKWTTPEDYQRIVKVGLRKWKEQTATFYAAETKNDLDSSLFLSFSPSLFSAQTFPAKSLCLGKVKRKKVIMLAKWFDDLRLAKHCSDRRAVFGFKLELCRLNVDDDDNDNGQPESRLLSAGFFTTRRQSDSFGWISNHYRVLLAGESLSRWETRRENGRIGGDHSLRCSGWLFQATLWNWFALALIQFAALPAGET